MDLSVVIIIKQTFVQLFAAKLGNKGCDMKMNMPKFGIMCSLDSNTSAGVDG